MPKPPPKSPLAPRRLAALTVTPRRLAVLGLALGVAHLSPAQAEPVSLAPAGDSAFKLDALFHDWSARRVLPVFAARGACDGPDLHPKVQVAYGPTTVWVALQVQDDRFVAGDTTGDALSLRFVLPDGSRRALRVALNDLEPPKAARLAPDPQAGDAGKSVPAGAEVVATARVDGWALEIRLPRSWLPGFTAGPVRFAAVVSDADADPASAEAVCAAGSPLDAEGWPAEAAFTAGDPVEFIDKFKHETGHANDAVLHAEVADLTDDGEAERLLVTDRDVVVASHALPEGGGGYLYFSHGWPTGTRLLKAELIELDGRPGPEVLVERFGEIVPGETEARVVEIYGLRGGYLKRMFAHKLSEAVPREQLEANAAFKVLGAGKGAHKLQVGPVAVKGYNPGNAADVDGDRPSYFRFVWPWDSKKPQTYALQGDAWVPTGK